MLNEVYSKAIKLSYKRDLERLLSSDSKKVSYKMLSPREIEELSKKITFLPIEYKNILFCKYSFNQTPKDIEEVFNVENPKGKLLYIQELLSEVMGLNEEIIDGNSLKAATDMALKEYTAELEDSGIEKPKYSKKFKRAMKEINIKVESNFITVAKKIAMFVLILSMTLSFILATNAKAREKLFDWIIERYEKYSVFTPDIIDEKFIDKAEITELKINYLPDEFDLIDTNKLRNVITYDYLDTAGNFIYIRFLNISDSKGISAIDTEGVKLERIITKGSIAYYWERDKGNHVLWQQNGIECHITSNLNKDEIFKIIESISK